jgi:molybdopterin synthase sulfur carrier subunit
VSVQVNLPTVLRSHAGGAKSVSVDGATVGAVLVALASEYPGLSGQVIDSDGSLHKFVNVYLNDDDVRYLSSLDTPVTDADEISILPAVAGGAGTLGDQAGPRPR